jgi:thiamine biosynthesis lipoprotein
MRSFSFEAIGTKWVIDLYNTLSDGEYASLEVLIKQEIERFDKTYSRFREDSLVTQLSTNRGEYRLPQEGIEMLQLYKRLYDLTDGSFTPLIGSLLEEAGYDKTYSLKVKEIKAVRAWDDVISINSEYAVVKEPVLLDFGALGKGKAIDNIAELLEREGINAFCIDAGGDIRYRNNTPLRVGLEHPSNTQQVIGVAQLLNRSIAASAGNRRKWGSFHHIIDPKTLRPVDSVLATWVIADTGMLADALATALFFTPASVFTKDFSFSYLLMRPDQTVEKSEDFPAELYYNDVTDNYNL